MKLVKPLRILIATLKGGPGKTTSAVLLAIAMAQQGLRVAVICADTRTRGATDWCQEAERLGYQLPFELYIWKEGTTPLSKFARDVEAQSQADVIIVDTGGEQPEAFTHGCLFADILICPVGPMKAELRRLVPTYMSAYAVNESGSPIEINVLLTRVPAPGKGRAFTAREDLTKNLVDDTGTPDPDTPYSLGLNVLTTEIIRNIAYDDVYGTVPEDPGDYTDLAKELLDRYATNGAI
ncbi:ParA family protein [Nocardia sp. NPDC052566]|uniref:ParA family protein n=1 Tax=Nocardia sp. NPDC052566 TaxID=3364330 RepID=UPI0037C52C6F